MIGKTLLHYKIVERLGTGGMGEVYVAEDAKLGRRVALKVLPARLAADADRRMRFEREARAVAALNHPNIVTVHSVEEAEGVHFLTMELVQGNRLSDQIPRDGLPLDRLFDVAIPLTDAIAAAHQQGITHRDLKPDNVMLTPEGRVKVLDFGLAKLRDEAGGARPGVDMATATLTAEGKILGTVNYMSPEQAEGKPVDHRSDIFSLGILLYEMATGRKPFQGDTAVSTISSIMKDTPVSISDLRRTVPRHLGRVVNLCLAKDPGRRYQSALDVRNELEQLRKEFESGELDEVSTVAAARAKPRTKGVWIGLGVAAVAVIVGVLMLRPGGREAGGLPATPAEVSLGVIGFENLGDPDDAGQLGRMLMSLVTTDLAESGGLNVVSTAKILAARRKVGGGSGGFDASLATDAAREAGADVMLVGQVMQDGSRMLLTAELVDSASGRTLGSLKRDATSSSELFALAGSIAGDIRSQLGVAPATVSGSIDLSATLTSSPEAYRQYTAGELALHDRQFDRAIDYFERAVREDPTFALAYYRIGIAASWAGNTERCMSALEEGLNHIDRLPQRWQTTYRAMWDYERGEARAGVESLEKLLRDSPDIPDAYNLMGEFLTHYSRFNDIVAARDHFEKALEIDPTFKVVFFHLMDSYIRANQLQQADQLLARYREEDPEDPALAFGDIALLHARKRYAGAIELAEEQLARGEDPNDYYYLGTLIKSARWDRANEVADRWVAESSEYLRGLALQARACARFHQGGFGEALVDLEQAAPLMQTPVVRSIGAWMHVNRAGVLAFTGDFDGAVEAADQAIQVDAFSDWAHYFKGYALLAVGRLDEAKRAAAEFDDMLERSRSPAATCSRQLLRAEERLTDGRPDEALTEASGIPLDRCPDHKQPVAYLRARAHVAAGDSGQALAAYREVVDPPYPQVPLEIGPKIPTLYQLARLEEETGDRLAAREHYRRFLDHWGDADRPLPEVVDAKQRLARLE